MTIGLGMTRNTEPRTRLGRSLEEGFGLTPTEIFRNRAPFKLQFLFRVHNFLLSAGSALLLALMLEEM